MVRVGVNVVELIQKRFYFYFYIFYRGFYFFGILGEVVNFQKFVICFLIVNFIFYVKLFVVVVIYRVIFFFYVYVYVIFLVKLF